LGAESPQGFAFDLGCGEGERGLKIAIVAVGKLREAYWQKAAAEYVKRIGIYARLEIVEVSEEANGNDVIRKEGARVLSRLDERDFVAALCLEGEKIQSERFARFLEGVADAPRVVFLIGGSLGLSPEAKARANFALSLSDMTFPHQMARVILLEQIYRAFKIMKNEPYHK
jgi:23S rRNA (pseudouridine1915-N3)-methyltransferase